MATFVPIEGERICALHTGDEVLRSGRNGRPGAEGPIDMEPQSSSSRQRSASAGRLSMDPVLVVPATPTTQMGVQPAARSATMALRSASRSIRSAESAATRGASIIVPASVHQGAVSESEPHRCLARERCGSLSLTAPYGDPLRLLAGTMINAVIVFVVVVVIGGDNDKDNEQKR
jgi:hypothetical protein